MKTWLALLTLVVTSLSVSAYEEYQVIQSSEVTVQDKWFGDYYVQDGKNDDILKVGGWGDHYWTFIKFPIDTVRFPGLCILNRASLVLYSYGSQRATSMTKYFLRDPWIETSSTDHWNVRLWEQDSIPAPPETGEYTIDITAEFYSWYTEQYPNYGIGLKPEDIENKFNIFLSSENARQYGRPKLKVAFERVPSLKLPLPGGKDWKLTVECGGKQFDEEVELDEHHTGHTYYSLDFSPYWLDGETIVPAYNVPIYAPAAGKVLYAGSSAENGNYVKIDHDSDMNPATGYQTVLIHMRDWPLVSTGQPVSFGQKLGIMGDTGISQGVHLHMTVYFQNRAGTTVENGNSFELDTIKMEGITLKSFKVGTSWFPTEPDGSGYWLPWMFAPSSNPSTGMQ
jgi:hypothetical protein